MKKLISSKLLPQIIAASITAIVATIGIVSAATTIGNNINTGGTLTATGAATIYGATSIGGALTATSTMDVSKGITIAPGYGLDATGAGVLNIGTSTATLINIGSPTGTVAIKGNLTIPGDYSLDANGVLNIGTSTATAITIGKAGITTTNAGALTVTGLATLNNNITVPGGYGLDASGALNIGTTTATQINIGSASAPVVMTNASSTLTSFGGGTTVSGLLFGTCAVNFGTTLGAGAATTTNCAATGVDSTYKVFMTPSNLETYIAFNSASSTAGNVIQVQVFNTSTSTPAAIASHTWSWMAIK